ncbi:MAG: hypothetical protein IJN63_07725 [Clostridia bacterium]|nr:hypothetical protein [Clostridia bacterium]
MKNKTFWCVFCAVIGICLVLTVAHALYAVYAYNHCSIIYFIGKELW